MKRNLIVVLEDNSERIEALNALLDNRLPQSDRFIALDPDLILQCIASYRDEILILSLDHDLFEWELRPDAVGMEVVKELIRTPPSFPVLVHSSNAPAAAKMVRRLRKHNWIVSSVMPIDGTEWIGREWYTELRRLIQTE